MEDSMEDSMDGKSEMDPRSNGHGGTSCLSVGAERPEPFDPLLKYFAYGHLQPPLQAVSRPFYNLARELAETLPPSSQRTAALQKLLEAKDCAVRAALERW
jgi:hypothetical protein